VIEEEAIVKSSPASVSNCFDKKEKRAYPKRLFIQLLCRMSKLPCLQRLKSVVIFPYVSCPDIYTPVLVLGSGCLGWNYNLFA